jgi:acyl-CoA reductase-like NAD-dependent aldehyde dehydrogenase
LKASELCPWTHYFLVETFLEAGFPPGSVNMIMSERTEAPAVTEAIVSHPSLAKIEFIGSAPVGKQIGAVAAKYLKPVIMELGDQSPLIVLDDADLEKAARDAIAGCVACHGQLCFGTERIIVQRGVKDKFYDLLRAALANAPPMGAAVTKFYAERAKGWVDEAVQKGAEFLAGKSEWTGPASFTPSILINLPKDCYLYDNEGFCPTMFVVEVDTDEEAIVEANSRDGGLSASVYTTNWERGLNMSKSLDFGNVQINLQTNQVEATGPVTGWKASGYGSGFGRYSIEEFIHLKTVAFGPTGIDQLSNSQQGYERMN